MDAQTTDASSKGLYFKPTVNLQDASAHPSVIHLLLKAIRMEFKSISVVCLHVYHIQAFIVSAPVDV